ncbi:MULTISPECIES: hypothetical protein [Bacillus]|uniref:hypothetical protein n=1 Tax=Bacillus TaxID=1386 RepID=UPI000E2F46CB|nr:hypothetical protein [Bacillus subtilis]MED3672098.1 hypothetical protein [Bacillus subtilis]
MKFFYSRRLWFTVLFLIIGTISVLLFNNWKVLITNWFDTLKYAFAILGLISTMYNYWKKFNIFVTRVKIILFNSSSKLSAKSIYEGDFNHTIQQKIKNKLQKFEGASSFNAVNNKMFTINIDGLHLQFDYVEQEDFDETGTSGRLICKVDDFYCSYDKSIDIFQNKLTPIFRTIEKETNAKENKYSFKLSFKGKNPFVSLIAKNVDVKKVHNLWYNYDHDTIHGKRTVKVTDKSLECTTNDITDFQNSGINFISLVGD